YLQHCASCHAIHKNLTGPGLAGVTQRGPWKNRKELYRFINLPAAYIPKSAYTINLQKRYYGQIMPAFPELTPELIDALLLYVENHRGPEPKPLTLPKNPCRDSCERYFSAMATLDSVRNENNVLKYMNAENTVIENIHLDSVSTYDQDVQDTDGSENVFGTLKPRYYQFDISSPGWFNIDKMLANEEALKKTWLEVFVTGDWDFPSAVYMVIPSHKVFMQAHPQEQSERLFGFYNIHTSISLPSNVPIYVFALNEKNGQLYFASTKFTVGDRHRIQFNLQSTTKNNFQTFIHSLSAKDVLISVSDAPYAEELRANEKSLLEKETITRSLKPLCDCKTFFGALE
ncbi:MAG TPA: cytochrome c, partial [Chitinophagaceae bacterium]|nr:cytochrome c [Chitinophagaceae bacterium]